MMLPPLEFTFYRVTQYISTTFPLVAHGVDSSQGSGWEPGWGCLVVNPLTSHCCVPATYENI